MTLKEKLSKIQQELKAPKNLTNKFGGYNYRNAEGIMQAVKPFEDKYKVCVTLSDDVLQMGERYYIVAFANIWDCESEDHMGVQAMARESEDKKGMDGSQITGAASSYARKYALNGLFLLDDTKDADTNEFYEATNSDKPAAKKAPAKKKTAEDDTERIRAISEAVNCMADNGVTQEFVCKSYGIKAIKELSLPQAKAVVNNINRFVEKQKEEETK